MKFIAVLYNFKEFRFRQTNETEFTEKKIKINSG